MFSLVVACCCTLQVSTKVRLCSRAGPPYFLSKLEIKEIVIISAGKCISSRGYGISQACDRIHGDHENGLILLSWRQLPCSLIGVFEGFIDILEGACKVALKSRSVAQQG
jgi:hypothetical protein